VSNRQSCPYQNAVLIQCKMDFSCCFHNHSWQDLFKYTWRLGEGKSFVSILTLVGIFFMHTWHKPLIFRLFFTC
jgi:hypothetical protein